MDNPILETPEYTVELWDINGVMVMDVSAIIATQLRIELHLNDIESIDFSIDLVQFEQLCASIGVNPRTILEPYRTDVRIRRNGEYLCGAQIVRATANFNTTETNKISIQCTGYLNYFKDRFITASYSAMTYAQIARQMITDTQAQTNGDFGVILGVDQASPYQQADRVRNYDLQNIKDGIINLTKLEDDNFDFQFTAGKVFNIYSRLGSDRPEVEFVYPQNIASMSVKRDASTLANKIIGLGSGIGEERLESIAIGLNSAIAYRIRERTELFSSVINQTELDSNTYGKLSEYQYIYEVPALTIVPNEIDLNSVGIGDAVTIRVDGSTFIDNLNGMYRIQSMTITVSNSGEESVSLDVYLWEG